METTARLTDDNQPATKGDVRHLEGRLGNVESRLDKVEKHIVKVEGRLDKVEERLAALLMDLRDLRQTLVQTLIAGIVVLGGLMTVVVGAHIF